MSHDSIEVPYNRELKPLEELLKTVRRPGDFFAHGTVEIPLPKIEVTEVGVLSFPIPETQIRELIRQADRAPYGRGEETIVDTAVRKVWQVPADRVSLGGKSWEKSFRQILATAATALGCEDSTVTAELYKLLIYDQGAFFKAHRDTEKADGMFGTLVLVLPSAHRGGELAVRHAGREVIRISGGEFTELTFAAFYADCEHEVRPITSGNRVCLVFNLIQPRASKEHPPLKAPSQDPAIAAAAAMLESAFATADAPAKLTWLLEHHYSPAGLAFAGLKGADAALASVLRQAGNAPAARSIWACCISRNSARPRRPMSRPRAAAGDGIMRTTTPWTKRKATRTSSR